MTGPPASFDPTLAFQTLARNGVRYVLIGGLAARVHGSPMLTNDVDVCYARDRANLEALATALNQLHATLRGAPVGLPFALDADTLQNGDHFTFSTDAGPVDVLGTPAGSDGYDQLVRNAEPMLFGGLRVLVAHVDDLIQMKRAAGRPKDLWAVENLTALRDHIDRQDDPR